MKQMNATIHMTIIKPFECYNQLIKSSLKKITWNYRQSTLRFFFVASEKAKSNENDNNDDELFLSFGLIVIE